VAAFGPYRVEDPSSPAFPHGIPLPRTGLARCDAVSHPSPSSACVDELEPTE